MLFRFTAFVFRPVAFGVAPLFRLAFTFSFPTFRTGGLRATTGLSGATAISIPNTSPTSAASSTATEVVPFPAVRASAAPLQDRFAESILQTLVEVGPGTLRNPEDYDLRASFMWSATLALNTLIGCGVPQDWSTHMIGHELTAFYGLDHAESLAIVMPGVWTHELKRKEAKLKQYGKRIWNVCTAREAIAKTERFFNVLGMPTRFGAYQIDANEAARKVRNRFTERGTILGEHNTLTPPVIAAILRSRA